jgi:hypothetical protein
LLIEFTKAPLEMKSQIVPCVASLFPEGHVWEAFVSPCRAESVHAPRSGDGSCSHVIMNHLVTTPSDLPGRTEGHGEVRPLVKFLWRKKAILYVWVY